MRTDKVDSVNETPIPAVTEGGGPATDVEKHHATVGHRPDCFSSTITEVLYVATCTMAIAGNSLLVGAVTVISNKIGQDLNMTQSEVTWIIAASSLTCGAFLLFFGRLADLFGRKFLFVGSLLLFAVFSLAASFANQGLTLDILNGCIGLCSASAVPPAIGSLGLTYSKPSRRKNLAFASFSAGNPLGYALGTVASGIASGLFDWRASFRFLAILYCLVSIIAYFSVPPDHTEKLPLNLDTLKRFDIVGACLTVAGIGMFTASLSLASNAAQGWKTPYVLVLFLVGITLVVVFFVWENYYPHPLVPMWIWHDRDFCLLTAILMLGTIGFTSSLFWITIYFQRFWTGSALHVAAYILPCAVVGTLVDVFAGMFLDRIPNKILMASGTAVYVVSFLLLGLNKSDFGYWPLIFPALMIVTWGADLQFNVVNMYVMTTLPKTHQAIAGGIFQTMSRLGGAVGFGLTTAVFNAVSAALADSDGAPTSGYYADDKYAPYAGAFWVACAGNAIGLFLCCWLRVGTQGGDEEYESDDGKEEEEEEGEAETTSEESESRERIQEMKEPHRLQTPPDKPGIHRIKPTDEPRDAAPERSPRSSARVALPPIRTSTSTSTFRVERAPQAEEAQDDGTDVAMPMPLPMRSPSSPSASQPTSPRNAPTSPRTPTTPRTPTSPRADRRPSIRPGRRPTAPRPRDSAPLEWSSGPLSPPALADRRPSRGRRERFGRMPSYSSIH